MPASSLRVVVVTHIPSPYQVELFDALSASGMALFVIYLTRSDPGRAWGAQAFAHAHTVVSEAGAAVAASAIDEAGLVVFCTYRDAQVRTWIRTRARRAAPWCFWGERPGARDTGRAGRWYRRWRLRELHRHPVPIWGIGAFGIEGYEREFGAGRVYLNVPYFSDLHRFARVESGAQGATPAAHDDVSGDAHPERVKVLFSGTLSRRKGVDLLARAVREIAPDFPCLELAWLGGGELEPELRRCAEHTACKVVFHGFKDWHELPDYYRTADLLVAPSRYDGWGLIVPEAMAAGLPVVGTWRMGAALELISPRRNGWLIEAGEQAALTSALTAAVEAGVARLRQMGQCARARVANHQLEDGVRRFAHAVDVTLDAQPGPVRC